MQVLAIILLCAMAVEEQDPTDRLLVEMHAGQDLDKPEVQRQHSADRQREAADLAFRQQRDAEFSKLLTQMKSAKPLERWAAEQAILKSSLLADPARHKQFAEAFAVQFEKRGIEHDAALRIFASFADESDIPRLKKLLAVEEDFFAADHVAQRLYRLGERDCAIEFWRRIAKDRSHPCQFAAVDRLEHLKPEPKPEAAEGPALTPAK